MQKVGTKYQCMCTQYWDLLLINKYVPEVLHKILSIPRHVKYYQYAIYGYFMPIIQGLRPCYASAHVGPEERIHPECIQASLWLSVLEIEPSNYKTSQVSYKHWHGI